MEQAGRNIHRKVPAREPCRSARLIIKNEPVVGRNIFDRAEPYKGARLIPWSWTGVTKEVRICETVILVYTGGSLL